MHKGFLSEGQRLYVLCGEHVFIIKAFKDADSSTFTYSIPINYRDQAPIFLDAKGDFLSYELLKEKSDYNRVIKFKLPNLKKNQEIKISLNYFTLAKKDEYKNEGVEDEKSLEKWIKPTASVASNNILIKITSRLLKGFTKNQLKFVHNVSIWNAFHGSFFTFVKRNLVSHPLLNKLFLSDVYWYRLEDSISSLLFGSVCAGKANLQAAILRANGIPARILISTSMFFGKKEWLDSQHYLVEAYIQNHGWLRVQPGQICTPSKDNIILRIVNTLEENIAGNGFSSSGGAAPWFWFDNENVFFGIPEGHMSYNIPKSKKVGFPAIRGWRECDFNVSSEFAKNIFEITREVWDLGFEVFSKDKGSKKVIFDKAKILQKKAIDCLKSNDFEEYIKLMTDVKKLYKNL